MSSRASPLPLVRRAPDGAVALLYVVSGAAGLVAEVQWMHLLARAFGSTSQAAAVTLAAFLLGLGGGAAAGAAWAGRSRRPLAAYGVLEIGAALCCGLGLVAPGILDGLYGALTALVGVGSGWLLPARLLLSLLLVGPAGFLLGATWPFIAEHVARGRSGVGRRASLFYGLNTLGAAAGALLAAFVLPRAWGLRGTWLAAGGAAFTVGCVALWWGRMPLPRPPAPKPGTATLPGAAGVLAVLSGVLALALQVLLTRLIVQAFPSSVYVFGAVVATFLGALAVGAFLARILLARSRNVWATLPVLLAAAALLVAASGPVFLLLTGGMRPPAPELAFGAYLATLGLTVVATVFPPVVAVGTVLPLLFGIASATTSSPGRVLGRLAAWNTVGAVVGSLGAAFVLIPLAGLWPTFGAVAAAYATAALVLAARARRRGALLVAFTASAFVVGTLARSPSPIRLDAGERLLFLAEGSAGTVAVIERGGDRKLVVDNVFTLGGTHDARWEALQAHVPLLLHPRPQRVFLLGLGTGITAGGALAHPVRSVEVAELLPDVMRASRACFPRATNGLWDDPRALVRADDARHRLRWSREHYDVIIGDLFFPWEPAAAGLYSREHFTAVRERLAPGGVFAQWLPCYQLSLRELKAIARTFASVFDDTTLWRGDFLAKRPILALVGRVDGEPLDPENLRRRAALLGSTSGAFGPADAAAIPFHLYAGNLSCAESLLADVPVLTDDDPWLQWTAPRSERHHEAGKGDLAVGTDLLAFEEALLAACPPDRDPLLASCDASTRALVSAGVVVRRMAVRMASLDRRGHLAALQVYLRLVPAALRPDLDRWIE